jgi:hypothetical protein
LDASNSAAMTFIAGAKILANRIGEKASAPRAEVSADASALFHWCGMNPAQKPPSSDEANEPLPRGPVATSPA